MFLQRTITTLILVPLVIGLNYLGGFWLAFGAGLWGACAAWEFYRIVSSRMSPLKYFGVIWVLFFIVSPYLTFRYQSVFDNVELLPLLLTSAVILPFIVILKRKNREDGFLCWAWTVGGILYIGWLLSYLVMLRSQGSNGAEWVYLALLSNAGSDVFSYLVGRAIGRHKMAPGISPGKTWEGAVGGVAGSVAVSMVIVAILHGSLGYWQAFILGVIISIAGQFGGLVASLFKRNMGVKDSGNALPGHGGFIDRTDSVSFAAMATYYTLLYLFHLI
jgi:phosphatidate cytidylyltransferase